jgi:hypothetical protein
MNATGYALDLMRKNYENVGFIPAPRMAQYEERGQLWLQFDNGDPCGYLVFGNGWPSLKIYQCVIQTDARRLAHATTLVDRLIELGQSHSMRSIDLRCADDLEANIVWKAMGFRLVSRLPANNRRKRHINAWSRPIADLLWGLSP